MKIHVTCSKDYDIYLEKGLLEQLHDCLLYTSRCV